MNAGTHTAADAIEILKRGVAIPAHPLALTKDRKLDECRQRALTRYYMASGAGGVAVAVHTTQFAIRRPEVGLLRPVLELASEAVDEYVRRTGDPRVKIAGICGETAQAVSEAEFARRAGYHVGLLSLAALKTATVDELIAHSRAVAGVIPVMGFYLQPAVGGRVLRYEFWRRFAEIPGVVAIKMAPFNRYQTLDVVRAVAESGRADEITLYTGNDDNIVVDLLTPYRIRTSGGQTVDVRIRGGLLGHWAVWTQKAAELLARVHRTVAAGGALDAGWLTLAAQITDSNAAFFDSANMFSGCITGLHEVLRRQGLLEGIWTLDPHETLSPGQAEEIGRVSASYPHLSDDAFVLEHRDEWLK